MESQNIKLTLINTYDNLGGAAIACFRYGNMLRKYSQLNVSLIVKEHKLNDSWIHSLDSTWIQKVVNFFTFTIERLWFLGFELNKKIRFGFSPANIGRSITRNKLVRNADILHLHWINKAYLSINEIGRISNKNKVVFWTLHDMWAFTGGCHHSRDCNNFMGSCGNCHYLKQFLRREKDFSNMVFESKRENINFENIEIICPSQWLATLASRSNLLKKSKIHVLPNPIDIDTYKKLDKKQCCRDLGLDPGKAYLLFVAANVGNYYKGISILYQALELLKTKYLSSDDIEFLIVGANKSSPIEIQGYVVHNLGYISDEATMVKIYNAADTFVTPSLEENLPNTIMEALACGVPCVGFDTGGIKELIEHKSCGYVAKYKNVEDLVNGLIYCFEDKGRLQQLSFNAQKKASESYSYEVISAKLENLYKQALINRGYN